MPQRKVRVGLVGASVATDRWGGRIHAPIFQTLPETELVAVCTSRPETARVAAEKLGVRHAFTDYRKLVEMDEVDLVSVALRVDMHYPIVRAALEAGKHVFCEWPLAVTSQQAEELYALARKQKLRHVVGLQARCIPAILYLRDLIAQGYIGQPLIVNMVNYHDRGFWLKWSHALYLEKDELGGTIRSLGGHAVDATLWCLGELESLCADVDTLIKEGTTADTGERIQQTAPDNVSLIGRFKNGAMLSVQVSQTTDPLLGLQIYAYGTEGCLIASNDGNYHLRNVTVHGAKRLPTRSGNRGERLEEARPRLLPIPDQYNWTPEFSLNSSQFPTAQLVRRMVQGIAEGQDVRPSFLDGVRLHHLLEAVLESSRSRRWVNVAQGGPAGA